ncbi:glyoxalase/bleomycin resistance/dioxygenase family protein [Micromonospora sp. DR5-3]|uniref:VOC family protein n=1 Tax=unclassified Micromonospora TaxID=2617518 RepID=UPI0011D4F73A|nr:MULTISPECIES: VOC family protein [unclassified Micromonospora]MCW3815632.1 glyoxalase/bleomycin resistance/dioxygenase family protein [Micromonospora sp. DR5-3]TYC23800.1 glyoxalase/bleomycin resistance/dioxygenase family protein [Micromonospora sp. MP36]
MPDLAAIVIHCRDPYLLAPFWSAVTGLPVVEEDRVRLAERSLAPTEAVLLRDPSGRRPDIWISPADDLPARGRIHLDLVGDAEERAAVLDAGATVVREVPRWTVLADPEGNEFCLLPRTEAHADPLVPGH